MIDTTVKPIYKNIMLVSLFIEKKISLDLVNFENSFTSKSHIIPVQNNILCVTKHATFLKYPLPVLKKIPFLPHRHIYFH